MRFNFSTLWSGSVKRGETTTERKPGLPLFRAEKPAAMGATDLPRSNKGPARLDSTEFASSLNEVRTEADGLRLISEQLKLALESLPQPKLKGAAQNLYGPLTAREHLQLLLDVLKSKPGEATVTDLQVFRFQQVSCANRHPDAVVPEMTREVISLSKKWMDRCSENHVTLTKIAASSAPQLYVAPTHVPSKQLQALRRAQQYQEKAASLFPTDSAAHLEPRHKKALVELMQAHRQMDRCILDCEAQVDSSPVGALSPFEHEERVLQQAYVICDAARAVLNTAKLLHAQSRKVRDTNVQRDVARDSVVKVLGLLGDEKLARDFRKLKGDAEGERGGSTLSVARCVNAVAHHLAAMPLSGR